MFSALFKAAKNLGEKTVKLESLFGRELYAVCHELRYFNCLILKSCALFCEFYQKNTFISGRAITLDKALGFQTLEYRCKCTGVEIQFFAKFFYAMNLMLPKYHHSDVLSVGQIDSVQIRTISFDNFLGTSVKGETKLVFEF